MEVEVDTPGNALLSPQPRPYTEFKPASRFRLKKPWIMSDTLMMDETV